MEKIKKSHSFSKSLIRMPSKIGSALFVLFLIVIVGLFLSKNILPASAAACVPPATIYGTDTMSVSAPTTGTYNVWIRMLAPTATSNSIMLQVDSSSCFNAGGSTSIPTNSWTWVNYQNGSSSQVMQIALTSGSHSLQLIGTTQGVEIDNILLLSDPNCVPTGNGSNCTTNQPAPTAPTNVTATANSPTSVTLNWAASTDAGGPGLGGYYVFRGGTKIATVSSSTTSYIDNSVVGATSYSYTIQAFDSSATPSVSPASTAANITTPAAKPSTPTGVTANAVGATSVSLSWTASTDVGGPGLAGYYILRGGTKIATVGVTTSYTDNTAAANTTYSYTIQAFDSASTPNVSSPSTAVSVTTPAYPPPSTPTGLTAAANSSTNVSLNWTASTDIGGPGLAGYNIYRNGTLIGGSTSNAYADTTVTPNTSYSYTVIAFDKASPPNVSSSSATANVTTPNIPTPSTPTGLSATAISPTSVTLNWSASTDVGGPGLGGYYVFRGGTKIATIGVTTSYTDNTAAANTTYSYNVEAFDSASPPNVSSLSTSVSVTTLKIPPPSTPTGLTGIANSSTSVTLNWSPSTDVGGPGLAGYYIIRNGVTIGQISSPTTTYTDNTVIPNTSYSYTVAAFDSASTPNVSSPSTAVSVTTPNPPESSPPTQPTNLTATAVSTSQINLSWTASADNIGVTGYNIYRNGAKLTTVSTNSYGDTGLTANTFYSYYVVAFDAAGNNSLASTTVSATTLAAVTTGTVEGTVVDTNTNLPIAGALVQTGITGTSSGQATAITNSAGQYSLSNITVGTNYSYSFSQTGYASKSFIFSIPTGITIYNVSLDPQSNLALNHPVVASSIESSTYPATKAVDGILTTRWASALGVDPQWIYVDLGANYNINEVKLNWEVAYAKAYQIQISTNASTWTSIYSTTTGTGGVNDLTGLSGNGRYVRIYGTVRGTQWGYSLWDMAVFGNPQTSPPIAPTAPSNLTGKANSSTSVSLSWTASTDVGGPGLAGYYILRGGTKIATVGVTTSYTDNTAAANTTYSYTIQAFDSASTPNVSSPSTAVSVTTPAITTATNLALNHPVVASSIESSTYPATKAVDGILTTRWASALGVDPQWIYVDLGANYNINEVKLNWEVAYAKAYQIQISTNASTWTSIYSTTTGTGGVNDLTGLSGNGRYVRIYGTVRGTQWGYSLWDMAVFGTP